MTDECWSLLCVDFTLLIPSEESCMKKIMEKSFLPYLPNGKFICYTVSIEPRKENRDGTSNQKGNANDETKRSDAAGTCGLSGEARVKYHGIAYFCNGVTVDHSGMCRIEVFLYEFRVGDIAKLNRWFLI